MTQINEQIKSDILEAIDNDTLVLPSLPEVAIDVRRICDDDNAGIGDLVNVIKQDAALSARLIKVSNSPLYKGANKISDLNMAIGRLGMQQTSSLATGLAMQQMFQATTEMIDTRIRKIWQDSTDIASICSVLVQTQRHLNPGQATLAGLIHSIGALPILRYVEDHEVQISSVFLDNLVEELTPILGEKILHKWEFPEELRQVPVGVTEMDRNARAADYIDLVIVAKLQHVAGTEHPLNELNWEEFSAFERLGLDPNFNMEEDEDLSASMEAAMALLA